MEVMNVREVAQYLHVNPKQVYRLIHERGLPATKVTGKWLFPKALVDDWLQKNVERNGARLREGEAKQRPQESR